MTDDALDGTLGRTGHEPPPFLHGSLADLTARANAAGFPTVATWVDHLERNQATPPAVLSGTRREIRSYIDLLEALPWVTGLGGAMMVSQTRDGPVEAAILTVNGYVHIRPPYRVTIRHTSDVDSGRPIPAGFLVEPS